MSVTAPATSTATRASVRSADGTTIGYRRFASSGTGDRPAIVLVHGALQASQSFVQLAEALAADFTVAVPDRRGRGASGPHGADDGIAREVEDIAAVIADVGATNLFGLSSGAIIALATAHVTPAIRRLALFEPPLSTHGSTPIAWATRLDRELARGRIASAMVTAVVGTQTGGAMLHVPRVVLVPMLALLLALEARRDHRDTVPIRALVPTVHYDAQLVLETRDTLAHYRDLAIPVLLLGGSNSPAYLGATLAALQATLPHATRVELVGTDHLAADNTGVPTRVAAELRRFCGA